jgi:DNA polymerase-3 subunit alpha
LAARRSVKDATVYRRRLEEELAVITRLGLARYLSMAHDLITAARERGIAVYGGLCGASASLACWALGLTEIDPVEHDLPFESFVNWRRYTAGNASMPFLTFAVCARRQHELLDLLAMQQGAQRVAVATLDGDPAWNALCAADADPHRSTATDFLDAWPDRNQTLPLARLLETDAELRRRLTCSPELRRTVRLALELERNAAVTCGPDTIPGSTLVVSPEGALAGVTESVVRDRRQPVIVLDRRGAEALGLFTVDCPPLPALTALAMARVPIGEPDTRVWDMIGAGDTENVVGLESYLHDDLRRFRPSSLTDLAAIQSVHRPGPIEAGVRDFLVERKHGRVAPWPLHPLAARAVARTYGVLLFPEQMINAAHAVSGLDRTEAEQMRRSLGKKRPPEIAYWETRFADGAARRGVDRKAPRQTFELLELWTPHLMSGAFSLALATLSLRMATLKAHAPGEFARVVREAYDD